MIYICNFHDLIHLLLIYICKLHWNLNIRRPGVIYFLAAIYHSIGVAIHMYTHGYSALHLKRRGVAPPLAACVDL